MCQKKQLKKFQKLKIISDVSYYTPEGLKKLKDELLQLEQIERPRVTQEIADARDKGDLSENAEYHAAKEEQSLLETKIAKLKNVVASARIIDESQLDVSKILINSLNCIRFFNAHSYLVYEILSPELTWIFKDNSR